jgi:hypothetical protein
MGTTEGVRKNRLSVSEICMKVANSARDGDNQVTDLHLHWRTSLKAVNNGQLKQGAITIYSTNTV